MKKFLAIIFSFWFGLIFQSKAYAGPVVGYYQDRLITNNNNFSATTLDFSLHDTTVFNMSGVKPGDSRTQTGKITKDGIADFNYTINFEKTSGDDGLCNALQIEAKLDGTTKYLGSLSAINLAPPITISGTDDWTFIVSLSDSSSSIQGKNCSFNLKFKGWQTDSDGTWGLRDEEIISGNSVSTDWWVSPSVTVLSPNGGEVWGLGEAHDITWSATSTDSAGSITGVDILLSTDSGTTYPITLVSGAANTGSWSWTIAIKSMTMKVKIVATDNHGLIGVDESDNIFDPDEKQETKPVDIEPQPQTQEVPILKEVEIITIEPEVILEEKIVSLGEVQEVIKTDEKEEIKQPETVSEETIISEAPPEPAIIPAETQTKNESL